MKRDGEIRPWMPKAISGGAPGPGRAGKSTPGARGGGDSAAAGYAFAQSPLTKSSRLVRDQYNSFVVNRARPEPAPSVR